MCENPFVRTPLGVKKLHALINEEARLAATPFPCGHCLPCRINKARIWTHRLLLEQKDHGDSSFVTLTYNDENLPKDDELDPSDLQKFVKRLRKSIPNKIRYFGVGEYGDQKGRPHYHLALFGLGILHANTISSAWNSGNSLNGPERGHTQTLELNSDLARYITGYITKYMTHKNDYGLNGRHPEFMRCSQGLGKGEIKRIAKELKNNPHYKNHVIRELQIGNKKQPLGRYLTDLLEKELGSPLDIRDKELIKYQQEIIKKHADEFHYVSSIAEEKSQQRIQQVKKRQIYKRKRQL